HTDRLGNPAMETDSTGAVIWRQSYTPYGETSEQADPDGPGFTGHRHDAATGLVYMQARYYDPKIGRFLSPDPVTFSPQYPKYFNRYWYAAGNPYKYTDPTGKCMASACDHMIQAMAKIGANHPKAAAVAAAVLVTVSTGGAAELVEAAAEGAEAFEAAAPEATAAGEEGAASAAAKGGETAATKAGRLAHKEFANKVKQKPGWQSEPRLTDPATGKTVVPDAVSPSGRPVELKPNTPSGRAQGKRQLPKYERATGKKGKVVHYDPKKLQ
ncbi:MAG TPA: RHS repeat-associated core domain-containing protein, partial [Gammaproteobacteria bacterium]|nr:RHS repeat-associated core domain-containing protein [Gammaproteobacteria bacterium]